MKNVVPDDIFNVFSVDDKIDPHYSESKNVKEKKIKINRRLSELYVQTFGLNIRKQKHRKYQKNSNMFHIKNHVRFKSSYFLESQNITNLKL